ncbi:hypothetical protein KEJ26_01715 [Candidatus Bathyarchaeota archaeon]|nr:hypothetical protein [Candidatus Bathyarchaeota archaeon]
MTNETILKGLKIAVAERREHDAWLDFSLREIREGRVYYYKVQDPVTGEWLFKICVDPDGKVIVKAAKCPPGRVYAQLEGDSMVFQKSLKEGYFYDVISLAYVDEAGRVRRKIISATDNIPQTIREISEIETYEKATGKPPTFGRGLVSLVRRDDYKVMITLFILQKAWPLASFTPETALKYARHAPDVLAVIRRLEKAREEEVYRVLEAEYGMTKDESIVILDTLKESGKIIAPEPGYIKVKPKL